MSMNSPQRRPVGAGVRPVLRAVGVDPSQPARAAGSPRPRSADAVQVLHRVPGPEPVPAPVPGADPVRQKARDPALGVSDSAECWNRAAAFT